MSPTDTQEAGTAGRPTALIVLGTPLQVTDYRQFAQLCQRLARQPGCVAVEFANTQVVAMRRHDPACREVTSQFDYFVPDGMPLLWCLNRLGANLGDRVYGPTFFRHLVQSAPSEFSHYFLGGTEESGHRLRERIKLWDPRIRVVGAFHGYCRPDGELAEPLVIDEINRLSPDFIWVGLGTPKQQAFIHRYKSRIRRGVILSVGFAFDVNAGTKRDAPQWMQRWGLTWLFRLLSEPGRLGPRYLRYNSLFLYYLFTDGLRPKEGEGSQQKPA